jgi:methyl-accepting chemotaxis protein
MQREMFNSRLDQSRAIVEMGLNLAAGLKKQVDAGEMTKEAALAEFSKRANSLTYDKGAGYLFGTAYNGITVLAPDPKQVGTNRMDVVTNGRKLSVELMDGVKANGSILLFYEYVKPGEEKPIRKMGYAVNVPGFDMYLGTGAYLDDLDAKMKPIAWLLGLAILGIGVISGSIAWMIGRSISKPLSALGDRMQALADGKLDGTIPCLGRGDEVGAMAATVQIFKDNAVRIRGLEEAEAATQAPAQKNPFSELRSVKAEALSVFAKNCSACHGDKRQGSLGPSLKGSARSEAELFGIISKGVGGMPSFGSSLDEQKIWKLVTLIKLGKADD